MANQKGAKYGFTGLFLVTHGHSIELRTLQRSLDNTISHPRGSPFSDVPIIHMARLFVIDGLAYQGTPARIDSLQSDYLLFTCDFDGDGIDTLVRNIPGQLAAIWGYCVRFAGIQRRDQLSEYFERYQLDNNRYLVDQPGGGRGRYSEGSDVPASVRQKLNLVTS
jgi:hypothetical protein